MAACFCFFGLVCFTCLCGCAAFCARYEVKGLKFKIDWSRFDFHVKEPRQKSNLRAATAHFSVCFLFMVPAFGAPPTFLVQMVCYLTKTSLMQQPNQWHWSVSGIDPLHFSRKESSLLSWEGDGDGCWWRCCEAERKVICWNTPTHSPTGPQFTTGLREKPYAFSLKYSQLSASLFTASAISGRTPPPLLLYLYSRSRGKTKRFRLSGTEKGER